MLAIFSRLNAGEAMPTREQLRRSPVLGWHLLQWPIASLAFLVVFAAGGESGAAHGAAHGAAVTCGVRRTARPGGSVRAVGGARATDRLMP